MPTSQYYRMPSPRVTTPLLACALILAALTSACAPLRAVNPSTAPWTNYTLNEKRHASIGATMIEWVGDGRLLPGFCVEEPVTGKGTALSPEPGAVWAAMFTYHGTACPGAVYLVINRSYYRSRLGFLVSADGRIPCKKAQMRARGIQKGRTYEVTHPPGTQAFKPCAATPVGGRSAAIKWELLYSGRSGDEIGISYREYTNLVGGQLARPAFYQELKYDLTRERRVTFRDTVIEVLDANNSGITFTVVSH
jgi:hypothetical protein